MISGAARGGTSMIAGIVYNLGVPMLRARPPVYEDNDIAAVYEGDDANQRSVIDNCNRLDQWAWKRPKALEYLPDLEQSLRNPRFIFVFRDVFSIANRNQISMDTALFPQMNHALEQYGKAISFLADTTSPCLLCSSEKVSRYPEHAVSAIAQFIGVTPTSDQFERSIKSIDPESQAYLKVSRKDRTHGAIDGIEGGVLSGWAAWWNRDEPVDVEIYLDDQLYTTVAATDFRADLKKRRQTREGYCGFSVRLSQNTLANAHRIRAKIHSDVIDLEGSPLEVDPSR